MYPKIATPKTIRKVMSWHLVLLLLVGSSIGLSCNKTTMDHSADVFIEKVSSYEYCLIGGDSRSLIIRRAIFDEKLVNLKDVFGKALIKPFQMEDLPTYKIQFYKKGTDNRPVLLGAISFWDLIGGANVPPPTGEILVEWDDQFGRAVTSRDSVRTYLERIKSFYTKPEVCLDWLRDISAASIPIDNQAGVICGLPKSMGGKQTEAVPVLESVLQNGDKRIRGAAAQALVEIDPNHIAAKKYLSQFPLPKVDIFAVVENGQVVFVIDHKNVTLVTRFKVSNDADGDLWLTELEFKGQKIAYGLLPKGDGMRAVETYRAAGGLPDILGKTVTVRIAYEFDGVYGSEHGYFRKEIEVPSVDKKQ